MEDIKSIKVSEFGYSLLTAAKQLLDDISPTPVTYDLVATLGAILVLKESGRLKNQLEQTPKGQIYMALVKALKQNQE